MLRIESPALPSRRVHGILLGLLAGLAATAAPFVGYAAGGGSSAHDTDPIRIGVPLAATQLVLLGWGALFVAVRATGAVRPTATGRAVAARPVLVGGVCGVIAGYPAARLLVGGASGRGGLPIGPAIAAGAGAVLGGVLVALVAGSDATKIGRRESRVDRFASPVARAAARCRRWRAGVVDLAVLVLAAIGVGQLRRAGAGSGGAPAWLAALGPGMVALAVGALAAGALIPLAGRAVEVTGRHAGWTATGPASPDGPHRWFALVTIAVTLAGYAILSWTTAAQARLERAELALGAARVITVDAVPPARLLGAVRAADPSGRYAMAVTEVNARPGSLAVLAVDSTRLAAVLPAGVTGGHSGAELAAMLHPVDVAATRVTGTSMQLNVTASGPLGGRSYVLSQLTGPSGLPLAIPFGPLRTGEHVYSAAALGCVSGCVLRGFTLSRAAAGDPPAAVPTGPPPAGLRVVLRELRQLTPDAAILTTAAFAGGRSWRTTLDPGGTGPSVGTSDRGLSITVPPGYPATVTDPSVYLIAAPVPTPVIVTGAPLAADTQVAGLFDGSTVPAVSPLGAHTVRVPSPLGAGVVPVVVADREPVLPRLPVAGYLIDLGYAAELATIPCGRCAAARSTTTPGLAVAQVWLAANAPASVVRAIAAHGLVATADQTVREREATYARQADVVALRCQLLDVPIGLALAAIALFVIVTAAPGSPRRPGRSGHAWLAAVAVVAGLIGAVVGRLVIGRGGAELADGWPDRPMPPLVGLTGIGIASAAAALTLGVATWLAIRGPVRAVRIREASR